MCIRIARVMVYIYIYIKNNIKLAGHDKNGEAASKKLLFARKSRILSAGTWVPQNYLSGKFLPLSALTQSTTR